MNKALIVMDIQNDLTKNYKEIIENVNKAIDWATKNNIIVIYIKHNNLSAGTRTFKPNTHGEELVPELKIVNENIFTKTKGNALTCEDFTNFINDNNINEFYITGGDATACVKSTCYNMRKKEYSVCVLTDCITSYAKNKIGEMIEYYKSKGCIVKEINDIM